MRITIENCQGGFLVEVQVDSGDPTNLLMPRHRDFKMVCVDWMEAETMVRGLFTGKDSPRLAEDTHGRSH
jgi:hypothetical protein